MSVFIETGWTVTVQHCKEIKNILAITELTITTLFTRVFIVRHCVPMRDFVSRPLLRLMYGEYWFRLTRLSIMVIDSFASYTKTKSVESAVWCLLTLDDDVETGCRYTGTSSVLRVTGSKYSMLQSWTCSGGWCHRRCRCRWVRTKTADHRSVWQRDGV